MRSGCLLARAIASNCGLHAPETRPADAPPVTSVFSGSVLPSAPMTFFSQSKKNICAVVPTCAAASSAFSTSGSATVICSVPDCWISGSATPRESTRLRMISIARLIASELTDSCAAGLAS